MKAEPQCRKRRCINFIGLRNTKAPSKKRTTVDGAIWICKAFPFKDKKGIPDEIAYGKNLHLKPVGGDNGILYKRAKSEEEFAKIY